MSPSAAFPVRSGAITALLPCALLVACGGSPTVDKEEAGLDASIDQGPLDAAVSDGAPDGPDESDVGSTQDASDGNTLGQLCSTLLPCASAGQYCSIGCVLEMTRGRCAELPAACHGVATCGCVPTGCGEAGSCDVEDGGGLVAGCGCEGPH